MKREQQQKYNMMIISQIEKLLIPRYRAPSYKVVCKYLNEAGYKSSVGNKWTERSLS